MPDDPVSEELPYDASLYAVEETSEALETQVDQTSAGIADEAARVQIQASPFGPSQAILDTAARAVRVHPAVRRMLGNAKHRLLSFELREPPLKSDQPVSPTEFEATFYDYTNNRTIIASGSLSDLSRLDVREVAKQPVPNPEEFKDAVRLVERHPELGPELRERRLVPYPPMPPVVLDRQPDGRSKRELAVGLLPGEGAPRHHEIVTVDMGSGSVKRHEARAPETAVAHNPICGLPNAGQATAARGTAGQYWVTVTQSGVELWRFLAVRPAASSGTNGSGVELRYVSYRGKRVLYQAHVPILNVKYDGNACGPYLDWQWQEGMLQAPGIGEVAPGFRVCASPATTILQTGIDTGNYLGVAIYTQGSETVLVSEMQAGWYRYVSEWRFDVNGTIRPRFGFGAVQNSCVCSRHHHHAYWRFDFDIQTAGDNIVQEFNNPPLFVGSNWHTLTFETHRPRDYARNRRWRISNFSTGAGYDIVPGIQDGVATASPDWPFPQGDVWALLYRPGEIEHGVVAVGPPYEANIGNWVTAGESINRKDVVLWYAGHATHDFAHEPGSFGHIVGPTLRPVNW